MIANQHDRTFDRRFYGVVNGIVVDNVDPDKLGRIKVSFPWYDDGTITEWCRVQQPYAGPGYGAFFIPEKNDEVLVAFVHGDMRMAIILGGLYSDADQPPSDRQADAIKNEKLIRTKGGHQILLDDTTGQTKIQITSKGGHTVELDDFAQTITIKTTSGESIVMNGHDGAITVTGTTISLGPGLSSVLLEAFLGYYNTHTHETAAGQTMPPMILVTPSPAVLSTIVKVT